MKLSYDITNIRVDAKKGIHLCTKEKLSCHVMDFYPQIMISNRTPSAIFLHTYSHFSAILIGENEFIVQLCFF